MNLLVRSLVLLTATCATAAAANPRLPLGRTLQAEAPLSYSFRAGSEVVRKTVHVRLEVEGFAVLHAPLRQFVEGGAMGVMADELWVKRWFSYQPPRGVHVDGEFVAFSEFLPDKASASFKVESARFVWTQGAARLAGFDLGSPTLPLAPKTDQPGYAADVINLRDIVGAASSREAFDRVRGKGPIVGAMLQVDGMRFEPPHALAEYLRRRDEAQAERTGFYSAGGFRNPVRRDDGTAGDRQAAPSRPAAPPPTRTARAAGNDGERRRAEVDRRNEALRREGDRIHRQSQQTWNAYQDTLRNVDRTFDQWRQAREQALAAEERKAEREALLERRRRDAAERREREAERERAEQERAEAQRRAERQARSERRSALLKRHPAATLPTSATRTGTNKLFYFAYAAEGDLADESARLHLSNVFAIGQYPDGTWPLPDAVHADIARLSPASEVVHGPYTTEDEALQAWATLRDGARAAAMAVSELRYDGRNAQVVQQVRRDAGPALDFWGNPVAADTKTTAPAAAADKPALDYWGNPTTK